MTEYPYALFDAFSEVPFGGSKAALVAEAHSLNEELMQQIAMEFGVPATGFITHIETDRHNPAIDIRFFSTMTEYPMCGHGTIGLLTWLIERGDFSLKSGSPLSVTLYTPASSAVVEITSSSAGRPQVMLSLTPAIFEICAESQVEMREAMAELFDIASANIDDQTPMAVTNSDFTHLMVPIKNLEAMSMMSPNLERIKDYCLERTIDTVMLFTTQTVNAENTVHCREFCPAVGTPEAPASGTTNRALSCYLFQYDVIDFPHNGRGTVFAEQGIEMGRPSRIQTELTIEGGTITKVRVGGLATRVMEGVLTI